MTITRNITVRYLAVADGGGGGQLAGSVCRGGAGSYLTSIVSLSPGTYTITVGGGGARNVNGNNSVFFGIIEGLVVFVVV